MRPKSLAVQCYGRSHIEIEQLCTYKLCILCFDMLMDASEVVWWLIINVMVNLSIDIEFEE